MRTTKCHAFHKLIYPKKCVFCINGALIAFTTGVVPDEEEKEGGGAVILTLTFNHVYFMIPYIFSLIFCK